MDDPRILSHLRRLRFQLLIRGVGKSRVDQILAETVQHLQEDLEESGGDVVGAIARFGDPVLFAKSLVKAERGWRSFYPYPVILTVLALFVPQSPGLWNIRLFGNLMSVPTFVWIVCGVLLCATGFVARRILMGQFVALWTLLTLGFTVFHAQNSRPVIFVQESGYHEVQFIPRGSPMTSATQEAWVGRYPNEIRSLRLGLATIRNPKPAVIAPELHCGGGILTPSGVAQLSREGYCSASSGSVAPSWDLAVAQWRSYAPDGRRRFAEYMIEEDEKHLANDALGKRLTAELWRSPQQVQVAFTAREMGAMSLLVCLTGFLPTFAGWQLWLFARFLRRLRRVDSRQIAD